MTERIPDWKKSLMPVVGEDPEAQWYAFLAGHEWPSADELELEPLEVPTGDELVVVLEAMHEFDIKFPDSSAVRFVDAYGHWLDHQCVPALTILMGGLVEPIVDLMGERLYGIEDDGEEPDEEFG